MNTVHFSATKTNSNNIGRGPAPDSATLGSLLAATRSLTLQLEAALAAIRSPDAAGPVVPQAGTDAPAGDDGRLVLPTDWPKVGGRDFVRHDPDIFGTAAYQDLWKPRGAQIAIYAGACDGLRALAKRVHMPMYKVSTTGSDRVMARRNELRKDRYGSSYYADGKYVREDGWDNWFPSHLNVCQPPSPYSPVHVGERSLLVDLPYAMSERAFESAFDQMIRLGSVDQWSMTRQGRDHCETLGLDPAILRRFTFYPGGTDARRSPVREIVAINPMLRGSGADRLVAIAERVILEHLGLSPASPCAVGPVRLDA